MKKIIDIAAGRVYTSALLKILRIPSARQVFYLFAESFI